MPRYFPPVRDTSHYSVGEFIIGDGRRNYPSISPTSSGGSTSSSK